MGTRLRDTWRATPNWRGVAGRREFWAWLALVDLPALFVAALVLGNGGTVGSYVALALLITVAVPTISLTARRLHDSGRSAGWLVAPVLFAVPMPLLALLFALSCFDVCGPRTGAFRSALLIDFILFAVSSLGLLILLVLPSEAPGSEIVE